MVLLTLFAVVAVQLAAVGLYGVVSYGVSRRLREIGVRLAMGAEARTIGGWVLAWSLRTAAIGVLIGILAAVALTRLMQGLLYDTSPLDPATFVIVAMSMGLVAALAAVAPALRATRIDPVQVLRSE